VYLVTYLIRISKTFIDLRPNLLVVFNRTIKMCKTFLTTLGSVDYHCPSLRFDVQGTISAVCTKSSTFFLLWIPIRVPNHLRSPSNRRRGAIKSNKRDRPLRLSEVRFNRAATC